jgi:pimeloyl-ACP methyl ester carboxylesterase
MDEKYCTLNRELATLSTKHITSHEITGAGHALHLEAPTQTAQLIKSFLLKQE